MSLTDRDIVLYARDTVFADARTETSRKLAARSAFSFFDAAQAAVRADGHKVTRRVKDGIWAELVRINAEAADLPKLAA